METKYKKVSPDIIENLKNIVGEKNIILDDRDKLSLYGMDTLSLITGEFTPPEVVVKPGSTEEVSAILKTANEQLIPVTPRGAGTGLAGAATPTLGGIVLSLERMNKILEIDTVNRVAIVEAGIITKDLCRKVAEQGLMYAGYPMSTDSSFIGGNVATNAGGANVIKFGNTRMHILGLEFVLPNGEVLQMGGRFRKSTWGYDLMQIVIGSEGTLGIVTKVIVNLIPGGGKQRDLLVPFPDTETAVNAVSKLIVEGNIIPMAAEFMDKNAFTLSARHHEIKIPFADRDDVGAYLIIQLLGETEEKLEEIFEKAGELCLENGALDVFSAETRKDSENIWKIREEYAPGLRFLEKMVYGNPGDIIVPFSKIPEMMKELKYLEEKYQMTIVTVGHIADGNLHTLFVKPDNVLPDQWPELAKQIYNEMILVALRLGGVGSGEHGIGLLKKKVFREIKPAVEIEIMKGIKKTFDPNKIMNPDKIL